MPRCGILAVPVLLVNFKRGRRAIDGNCVELRRITLLVQGLKRPEK